jgi:two-component system OmpR family response regulator
MQPTQPARQTIEILLVEDDARARMLLRDVLTGAGYCLAAVADGEQALALLLSHTAAQPRFHVIVTDIRLGAIDGLQVLAAARACPLPPAVILLTGYGSVETAVAALRMGAFDYLLKPFTPAELLDCVARAVERQATRHQQHEAIRVITSVVAQLHNPGAALERQLDTRAAELDRFLQVGELMLDRHRRTATFKEHTLRLTPIEYALLICLGEMEGRVLGYADIIRRTHGHTVDDSEAQSMLKVHIHNLRQKIAPAYLINVRGTGYMLVAPYPGGEAQE